MSFGSVTFLFLFLPLVLVLYYAIWRLPELISSRRARKAPVKRAVGATSSATSENLERASRVGAQVLLLLASLLFYAWTALQYVPLLAIATVVVYVLALAIERAQGGTRRLLTAVGVIASVCLLVFYKYLGFFADTLARLSIEVGEFDIIQPLGISFFTFSIISYLIDVYRSTIPADKNFLNVAVWSFFFAKIVSGPIVRYGQMYREGAAYPAKPTLDDATEGACQFVRGLAKKVILADTLGATADMIFTLQHTGVDVSTAWLGMLCYTFQIYLDFAGYSDMAIGVARMLGFKFEKNFDYPYVSKTVGEFWRRWHISLSTWLRDYLYFPLGGSRRGNVFVNLAIVFLVSGLWHGASWHFVAWGAWYAVFMIVDRLYRTRIAPRVKIPAPLLWLFTILVVMLGWVIFRAEGVTQAVTYLGNLVGIGCVDDQFFGFRYYCDNRVIAFLVISAVLSTPVFERLSLKFGETAWWRVVRCIGIPLLFVVSFSFLLTGNYSPFLYAQF